MSLLDEISEWKIEAKNETGIDFFLPYPSINKLIDGKRMIVIGRKGTGKTAIAKFLKEKYNSEVLTFDLFSFSEMKNFEEESFNGRHDFISIWVNIIYQTALKNALVNGKVRSYDDDVFLRKIFDHNLIVSEGGKQRWNGFTIALSFAGFQFKADANKGEAEKKHPIRALNLYLEDILSKIFENFGPINIVFDEIDEGFAAKKINRETYMNLIISLIKACEYIKRGKLRERLRPIICIRSDIFSQLEDNDAAKWADWSYRITWDENKIRSMLAHRISSTMESTEREFNMLWSHVFTPGTYDVGKNKVSSFKFIQNYAQDRPRDYIIFLKHAAEAATARDCELIPPSVLKNSVREFSEYCLTEAKSELAMVFPNSEKLLSAIKRIRKQRFSSEDLLDSLKSTTEEEDKSKIDDYIYHLCQSNIIGNILPSGHEIFNFQVEDFEFDHGLAVSVHKSFLRALNIV